MSALHYVAQHGFDREASLLLDAGVDVDAVNNVGNIISHVRLFLFDILCTSL